MIPMDMDSKTTSLGLTEVIFLFHSREWTNFNFYQATCLAVSLFNLDILWFYLNVPNGTIQCEKQFLIYSKVLREKKKNTIVFCTKNI